jgi:hypothetical protein
MEKSCQVSRKKIRECLVGSRNPLDGMFGDSPSSEGYLKTGAFVAPLSHPIPHCISSVTLPHDSSLANASNLKILPCQFLVEARTADLLTGRSGVYATNGREISNRSKGS